MRPLIIDPTARADIARVIRHAEANPVSLIEITRAMSNPDLAVGNKPEHVCTVPIGYRCVFSIEQQPKGMCRHLSVSVVTLRVPSVEAMELLMGEFRFSGGLKNSEAWREDLGGGHTAINVIQLVDQTPSFTCPRCGRTSYHPKDIEHRYCGNCHAFTSDEAA